MVGYSAQVLIFHTCFGPIGTAGRKSVPLLLPIVGCTEGTGILERPGQGHLGRMRPEREVSQRPIHRFLMPHGHPRDFFFGHGVSDLVHGSAEGPDPPRHAAE